MYAVPLDHSGTPAQFPVPLVAVEDAAEELDEPLSVPPEHALTGIRKDGQPPLSMNREGAGHTRHPITIVVGRRRVGGIVFCLTADQQRTQ